MISPDLSWMTSPSVFTPTAWALLASFLFSAVLVLTKRLHGEWSMDFIEGVQKFHTELTPRIGGVPIVLALVVAWGRAPLEVKSLLTPILIAGMPAFLFGVAEDITKRVGITQRLLATMCSGLLAWWVSDVSLSRVDIWGLDWILGFSTLSVLFTAVAVAGIANAINIIDGVNGLAGLAGTAAFLGFALIAHQAGDTSLATVSLLLAASVCGFFWVNWPLGKIFLGDGGAYFVGFALAWVAVLLVERNPSVSAFAALLICVHPVVEVLLSIYRRGIRKAHPGMPDQLHFHSLLKRRYIRRWFRHRSALARNSIAGVAMGSFTLMATGFAYLTYASAWMSATVFGLLALAYVATYIRMVHHRWCLPRSTGIRR